MKTTWPGLNQPTARAAREYAELEKPENSTKAKAIRAELNKYYKEKEK